MSKVMENAHLTMIPKTPCELHRSLQSAMATVWCGKHLLPSSELTPFGTNNVKH